MAKVLIVGIIALASQVAEAGDCCSSYTDAFGIHHDAELCANFCCFQGIGYKVCCDEESKQVPASERDQDACVNDWLSEHVWVPIVGGILGLVLIISILTCCCCCGCCACCRRSQPGVIIAGMPSTTTVAMSSTVQTNHNPAHYGYDQ